MRQIFQLCFGVKKQGQHILFLEKTGACSGSMFSLSLMYNFVVKMFVEENTNLYSSEHGLFFVVEGNFDKSYETRHYMYV